MYLHRYSDFLVVVSSGGLVRLMLDMVSWNCIVKVVAHNYKDGENEKQGICKS